MGRRSTVTRDPAIETAANAALDRGATIDEVKAALDALGHEVSRSAIGRHVAGPYAALVAERRKQRAGLDMLREAGEDEVGRLNAHLLDAQMTVKLLAAQEGEEDLSPLDLSRLAGANARSSATITGITREARERHNHNVRLATDKVLKEAKRGGASSESLDTIKRDLLGLRL